MLRKVFEVYLEYQIQNWTGQLTLGILRCCGDELPLALDAYSNTHDI